MIGDATPEAAIACLEHIGLATSESMQAQTLACTIRTLAILLEIVPPSWQERLADVSRRSLSSLGEHVLTCELQASLEALSSVLTACGFGDVGEEVRSSTAMLATTLGKLNSRSTRVPAGT